MRGEVSHEYRKANGYGTVRLLEEETEDEPTVELTKPCKETCWHGIVFAILLLRLIMYHYCL